jgi:hypothetical protein
MTDFYNIRQFACEHFFAWEIGEDFDWIKKEWKKFEPHLKNEREVEDFILSLAKIYNSFCHAAYFEDVTDEDIEKYPWIIQDQDSEPSPNQELEKRIENYYDKTLDILLEVYTTPEEILRQFTSVFIDIQLPSYDGYKFIFDLFKDKWNPDKDLTIPIL